MGFCIALVSGKGGTGKSTTATVLAHALSKMGKNVLLIDLDEGLRCLDVMLGVDDVITLDLSDILSGRDVGDALYPVSGANISLIPAPLQSEETDYSGFPELLRKLCDRFDVVIADLPAGLNPTLLKVFSDINAQIVTVCSPDPVSLRDASAVAELIGETTPPVRLIINRFDYDLIKSGIYSNVDDMIDISQTRLLGVLPYCRELMLLSVSHKLKTRSKSYKAAERIARRLCGEAIKLPRLKKV